jgi:hypothetical protein
MGIHPEEFLKKMTERERINDYTEARSFFENIYLTENIKLFINATINTGCKEILTESGLIVRKRVYLRDLDKEMLEIWFKKYLMVLITQFDLLISFFEPQTNFSAKDFNNLELNTPKQQMRFYFNLLIERNVSILQFVDFLRNRKLYIAVEELLHI